VRVSAQGRSSSLASRRVAEAVSTINVMVPPKVATGPDGPGPYPLMSAPPVPYGRRKPTMEIDVDR
jgi:hypothetical protein